MYLGRALLLDCGQSLLTPDCAFVCQVHICKWIDLQENVTNQCLHLHFQIIPNTCFEKQTLFLQCFTVLCSVHVNRQGCNCNEFFSFLPSKFPRKRANYGREIWKFHRKCEKPWVSVGDKAKNIFLPLVNILKLLNSVHWKAHREGLSCRWWSLENWLRARWMSIESWLVVRQWLVREMWQPHEQKADWM